MASRVTSFQRRATLQSGLASSTPQFASPLRVSNQLPVLAPQLYVAGVKLCDEDVDLGLSFALSRMLSAYRDGTLRAEAGGEAP